MKFSELLIKIKASRYSIITINYFNNEVITVDSNISKEWRDDFVKNKLYFYSELVITAKEKITPLSWDVNGINSPIIKKMSIDYGIKKGITFTIKMSNEIVLFTIYFQDDDSGFNLYYSKNKHKVFYDILDFFENNYKPMVRYTLTSRELEIMTYIKFGKTYDEAGKILGITERTVRFHLNNVMKKLSVSTVKQAIVKAIAERLV